MQFLAIVLVSLLAGMAYGVLHDQVTIRVCLEYFTVGHPPLFSTRSPTLLALGWGIAATWWMALPLGFALATAARLGSRPRWSVRQVLRPLLVLLAAMAAAALAGGIAGFVLAAAERAVINPWISANIEPGSQARFVADWWAHSASYLAGVTGGAVLCLYVWMQRGRQASSSCSGPARERSFA